MEFHGIQWTCSCHRNRRTPSSMDFHGTAHVIEIAPIEVPWNSMEFHGTARVIEMGALQVQWNSTEFHGTASVIKIGALQVPRNSMELLVLSELAHSKFHGIPWNLFTCYLMEPCVSSILRVLNLDRIPWNSSSNFWCQLYSILPDEIKYHSKSLFDAHWNLFWSKSSMELAPEFYGTFWTTFEQHLLFDGIPWNLSNKTSGSMEFQGILSRSKVPWNSMELLIFQKNVPWHPMEFHGTWWNCYFKKIILLVFDWWLYVIWLKSHRNAAYCVDFDIIISVLNTPVSVKMAQGQRKWQAVKK